MSFPIPKTALDERLAIVGTSGSGKTYGAMGAVEHLLAQGAQTINIDPLGVMWGIRLCADGKTPSPYNVVIFGGEHGDLPINEHSGALIGEAVATMRESCIVDLSSIGTKAGERRFMLAFLTALYRHTDKRLRHLIIDEADMFAPQRLLDKEGEAAKLLGMMETVVRRGRVKGFIPWLITQRPAVLSWNVLSQAKGLVAFNLTAAHDRKVIRNWVESTADLGQWKEIDAKLPTFKRGEALVWLPERNTLSIVEFPPKATFDSSRAPGRGEKHKAAELKPLDLGALKEKLASVETEAKANDPTALKAEVRRLTMELAKAQRAAPPQPEKTAEHIEHARQVGQAEAIDGVVRMLPHMRKEMKSAVDSAIHTLASDVEAAFENLLKGAINTLSETRRKIEVAPSAPPIFTPPLFPRGKQTVVAATPKSNNGSLSGAQRDLLEALAWWNENGHAAPTKAQVAAVAGWKVRGSHLRNRLAELRGLGMLEYPAEGRVGLTTMGLEHAPAPKLERTLTDSIRAMLTEPQRLVFDTLSGGKSFDRATLAEFVNWEPGGSHLRNRLAELSALELIEYPQKGWVKLQDWVR